MHSQTVHFHVPLTQDVFLSMCHPHYNTGHLFQGFGVSDSEFTMRKLRCCMAKICSCAQQFALRTTVRSECKITPMTVYCTAAGVIWDHDAPRTLTRSIYFLLHSRHSKYPTRLAQGIRVTVPGVLFSEGGILSPLKAFNENEKRYSTNHLDYQVLVEEVFCTVSEFVGGDAAAEMWSVVM